MDELFLRIFNMSVTAAWLALAVVVMRLLLRKAPRWITVAMWALVGVRLLCPFSLESALSLIPSAETVPPDIVYSPSPEINSGIYAVNSVVNPIIKENFTPTMEAASVNPIQIFLFVIELIWIVGMAAMLVYTLISYFLLHRKVREAVPYEDNVWLCDRIASPFILGIIRPRIYLPSDMAEADVEYVLAHEKAHLKRRDHWWKPLGFLLLTVHWFNPILWIAYILLCRDIELACDEKVIRQLGTEIKKPYSDALINCSVSRKTIAACPLAFGEVGVKTRIKSVLNYKKPAFWVIVVAIVLCIALAVGFLTNPKSKVDDDLAVFIDCQIAEYNQSKYSEGHACCVSWDVLGITKNGSETTVYIWALYHEYSLGEDGELKLETGSHIPTAITAKKVNGTYQLVEYWIPRDGNLYAKDIMDKFPPRLWGEASDPMRYIGKQKAACEKMAREYFASQPDAPVTDYNGFYIVPEYINTLREKYPEYFGLDTSMGLEVYWYQMAANSYSWVLLPGRNEAYTWQDIIGKTPTTTAEMRAIVESYGLTRGEVPVDFVGMPHSSYLVPTSTEYFEQVRAMFWNTMPSPEGIISSVPSYLEGMRAKYPEYFGLDTSKGLSVYCYVMEEDVYSWVLLPGKDAGYTWQDILHLPVTTAGEMHAIVNSYGLPRSSVSVNYTWMPHSINSPTYSENVEELFWSSVPITDSAFTIPSYGSLVFDIDGDGLQEIVSLGYGTTSGVFSFTMTASYDGERKYRDMFISPWCEPQFLVRNNGEVNLLIKPRDGEYKAVTYDISVVDGHIVLTADEDAEEYFEITSVPVHTYETEK